MLLPLPTAQLKAPIQGVLCGGDYSGSPGITDSSQPCALGKRMSADISPELRLTMIGFTPAKVNIESGSARPGELFVDSSIVGYAINGTDRARMTGSIVGKHREGIVGQSSDQRPGHAAIGAYCGQIVATNTQAERGR